MKIKGIAKNPNVYNRGNGKKTNHFSQSCRQTSVITSSGNIAA